RRASLCARLDQGRRDSEAEARASRDRIGRRRGRAARDRRDGWDVILSGEKRLSMTIETQEQTGLGNYFVANYPPFSAWKPEYLPDARAALHAAPQPGTPLGLYLHIPFCRKRCKFCYFRVYTDKNARDIETYLDALTRKVGLSSRLPVVGGRPLHFFYFGGGTPSYLSVSQLTSLTERLRNYLPWDRAAEVTFECEPGTLQQHKLAALKQIGVTRL